MKITEFGVARRASVPLVAVRSKDEMACSRAIIQQFQSNGSTPTILEWDCIHGYTSRSDSATTWLVATFPDGDWALQTQNVVSALEIAEKLPQGAVLLMHSMGRLMDEAVAGDGTLTAIIQGMKNLRDPFAASKRMLVLFVGNRSLPQDISADVLTLEDPLPTRDELSSTLSRLAERSGVSAGDCDVEAGAVTGLHMFAAEQVAALSLRASGYDRDVLWDRTCQALNSMKGMQVIRGGRTFSGIGGCENVKQFMARILQGREAPQLILFMDELEKMLGGDTGDSGVSRRMLGILLSWMEDYGVSGSIFIGPPGAAKSAVAKATGNTAGIPTVEFQLSRMLGQYVGNSETALVDALDAVNAVSDRRVLCLATCNSIVSLPPELRRRFKLGTFFFDLPSPDERALIWPIYLNEYDLPPEQVKSVNDTNWTGAEIRNCCEIAWRLGITLAEASQYIVPVAISGAAQLRDLRASASGRYLSASTTGLYVSEQSSQTVAADLDDTGGRTIGLRLI